MDEGDDIWADEPKPKSEGVFGKLRKAISKAIDLDVLDDDDTDTTSDLNNRGRR